MPNWCQNRLTVSGGVAAKVAFADAHGENLTFKTLCPLVGEWTHEQAMRLWGTKWDIDGFQTVPIADTMRFETAWCPPTKWLQAAAAAHPDLTFTLDYYEFGVDFHGTIVAHGTYWDDNALGAIPRCSICHEERAVLWTLDGAIRPDRCYGCDGLPDPPAVAAPPIMGMTFRIPSEGNHLCGLCRSPGHNRRTCPSRR